MMRRLPVICFSMLYRARGVVAVMLLAVGCALSPVSADDPSSIGTDRLAANASALTAARGTVVLLHGLGRSTRSMRGLSAGLEERGFRTVSFGYPSLTAPIDANAERLAVFVDRCCAGAQSGDVHFVGHSLGGIVVRRYLAEHRPSRLGRVVMLASPNSGSELADLFAPGSLLAHIVGPSAAALGTGTDSVPIRLGPVSGYDVGVITGNRSWNPLLSWIIPGPDDGRVAVERAKLEGMRDFLVVPRTHTFLMNADAVIEQTARFLETGSFRHDDGDDTFDRAAPVAAAAGG